MENLKFLPATDTGSLRRRVDELFKKDAKITKHLDQLSLDISDYEKQIMNRFFDSSDIANFIDFCSNIIIDGDIYLFGGIIRDLALFGKKGFNSDIDIVVDGDWTDLLPLLKKHDAVKNKFGGYRLYIGTWPVDIWEARETWAIKNGYVSYKGIASLNLTTVLNWDAILMNWRTKNFIYGENYFNELENRSLKVLLEDNPNPLGMLVRVFRHMYLKEAKKIEGGSIKYIANAVKQFSYDEIRAYEFKSYNSNLIDSRLFSLFSALNEESNTDNLYDLDFSDGKGTINSLSGQISFLINTPKIH